MLTLLRGVLAEAHADGMVTRNVAARVDGQTQAPKRRQALTPGEVASVAQQAAQHRLSGCWLLTLSGRGVPR